MHVLKISGLIVSVTRSKVFLQANPRQPSDFLTLISYQFSISQFWHTGIGKPGWNFVDPIKKL